MNTRKRPWSVHRLRNIYGPPGMMMQTGLPDGRWVRAVGEPYPGNRLQAAWWVLTGRAYALIWPKAGELEDFLGEKSGDTPAEKEKP